MEIVLALVLFGVGLGLIIFFAEQLVKGVVGTSIGFGLSTFLLSVIFIGFDPDNLAVGTVASAEGMAGIALGSILGGAMVAVALAFGISALVAPMTFAQVSESTSHRCHWKAKDVGFPVQVPSLAFSSCPTRASPVIVGITPVFAVKPDWNVRTASVSLNSASFASSCSWRVIVPAIVRTAPDPAPNTRPPRSRRGATFSRFPARSRAGCRWGRTR